MNKLTGVALITFILIILNAYPANAGKGFIVFGWEEKIVKVKDLPNTVEYQNGTDGDFIDVGYKFKQINLFFIPVWNY